MLDCTILDFFYFMENQFDCYSKRVLNYSKNRLQWLSRDQLKLVIIIDNHYDQNVKKKFKTQLYIYMIIM
jgi:hypothetical protein